MYFSVSKCVNTFLYCHNNWLFTAKQVLFGFFLQFSSGINILKYSCLFPSSTVSGELGFNSII